MAEPRSGSASERKIFDALKEDVQRGDFTRSVRREFIEAREFMLEEERRERLGRMPWWKSWFVMSFWMFRSMFFRLTPARRILLVAGLVFILLARSITWSGENVSVTSDWTIPGALCLLFVLLLELKDKLVAREELEAGRTVQLALMPDRSPSLPGWEIWLFTRPANEVGGDLVDFLKVDEKRYGVVLGDVAGKGLRAALLMVRLQATIRALSPDFSSLEALASKLNQIFCRDSLRSIFASMVYVELLPHADRMRLVNAGHFPPVVIRSGKATVTLKGGAALGITPDAEFLEEEICLEEHDTVCIYSDGVTEAQNGAGAFLGEQRLIDYLSRNAAFPLPSIGDGLVAEVDRFIGEARTNDDLSIALIRRTNSGS